MYGARPVGSLLGISDIVREYNASGTFAQNDFVMDDGSTGEITVATAGSKILGVALEAGTSASTGVQVNVTPLLEVIMDNDNDSATFAATNVFNYGNFIGATGAMQVDTSSLSTTVAQLLCAEYNPQGYDLDSDTSIGKFQIVESHLLGYTE